MKPQALIAVLMLAVAGSAMAQSAADEVLLEQVRTGQVGDRADEVAKLEAFRSSTPRERQRLLRQAQARRDELQRASQELERTARNNDKTYTAKIADLRAALGPDAAMFGTLQTLATDLIGIFRNSPTSLEYPDREAWLTDLIARVDKASVIFTIDDLERLWFLIQQEITASGKIVAVNAPVLAESGSREDRAVVRVGKFVLIADQPRPMYLAWQADSQRASVLKRQPERQYLDQIEAYLSDGHAALRPLGIDPTGGSLLSRLVDAPSLRDRVAAGGLIGNLILLLGAVGVGVAVLKLIGIMIVSARVALQRRNLDTPNPNNPLGRMLGIYEANKDVDTDTLEMRLGEAILEERPKIDRFVGVIKVISVVAPLMGLMGTVIGMIATFQAITLFGTGDPKTMAGGISQALVTTVEGLTVAIPTVLMHAIVSARATALVNTLKHQTAGLIAERMEARAAGA